MRRPGSGGLVLVSLAISPELPSVAVGSEVQMTATGTYSDGSTANLTSAVAWSSSSPAIGTIADGAGGGIFTAVSQGTTNLQATLDGVTSNTIIATVPAATAVHASFPFPSALGATPEAGGRIYTFPIFIPPDVTTLDVLLANRISDALAQPSITVNVAVYQSDGTGTPTGTAFAVFNGQVVPGDNTILTIGPFPGIVRGVTDGQVVVLIGMAQGETPVYIPNVMQGLYATGTDNVSVIPGAWNGPNPNSVLDVHLEYNSGARRIVVIGDSLSVGYSSATVDYSQTQFILMASDLIYAIDNTAIINSNSSLAGWADFASHPTWYDDTIWATSDICLNLGTNDLAYNNLATMQASLATLIAHLQSLSVNNIYASTIPPQNSYPGTDTVRAAFNAWLLANFAGLGITAVRDRAAAQSAGGLADDGDPNTLAVAFAQGDGTNLTVAGYEQERIGWEATVA